MKRWTMIVLLLLMMATGVLAQEATPDPVVTDALGVLDRLVNGDYAGIHAQFSAQVQAMVTPEQLQEAWETLLAQAGAYQGVIGSRYETGSNTGVLNLQFALVQLDLRVTYDDAGQIIGLQFAQPTASQQPTPAPVFDDPPYADPAAYTESEVVIGEGGDFPLGGTLALPNDAGEPVPALILLSGSGPSDRDSTVEANKPLRDLALGLATQGIAVLRFDKRTFVHRSTLDLTRFTINDEYLTDALLALDLLRATDGIDPTRIYIAGHSLGGYVLPRIAAAADQGEIAGLIFLAPLARPLQNVIVDQQRYLAQLDGEISRAEQTGIDTIQSLSDQINALTDEDADDDALILGAPAVYWLDLQGYDPAATAAALAMPMLFIQGGRDYQVTDEDDLALWRAGLDGRADVTFTVFPALDHLLIPGDGLSSPDDYGIPGHVDGGVINALVAWIEG